MKTYDLCVSPALRAVVFIVLGVLTVGIPAQIVLLGGPTFLVAPILLVFGWNWWVLLSLAHRIVVHGDGSLEWVSFARTVRMLPEDIREISPTGGGHIGFFVVRYTGGKIRFINQITGFHEVLFHIKERNPAVILRGC